MDFLYVFVGSSHFCDLFFVIKVELWSFKTCGEGSTTRTCVFFLSTLI